MSYIYMERLFLMFLDHTQRRSTVGRTLDEWSARRRDLYLTTHDTHNTNIHAPGGIRTHDLSRWAAAGRTAELFKQGGTELKNRMFRLILRIWNNMPNLEERWPNGL